MFTFGILLNSGICCRHVTSDVSCIPVKVINRAFAVVNLDTGEVIKDNGLSPIEARLVLFDNTPIKSKMELVLA